MMNELTRPVRSVNQPPSGIDPMVIQEVRLTSIPALSISLLISVSPVFVKIDLYLMSCRVKSITYRDKKVFVSGTRPWITSHYKVLIKNS